MRAFALRVFLTVVLTIAPMAAQTTPAAEHRDHNPWIEDGDFVANAILHIHPMAFRRISERKPMSLRLNLSNRHCEVSFARQTCRIRYWEAFASGSPQKLEYD